MGPPSLQLSMVYAPNLISNWYHETKILDTAGYIYFKGEFRRQYLSEDINRREQETLSFLGRIDADMPGARQEFKSFWLNTAADTKNYMNVSRRIFSTFEDY